MTAGKVHVVGAGLAGLSAAVALAGKGVAVELSEATGQAGGRCRSYFDPQLGLTIDNGNHLVLSGNQAVMRYLRAIGAQDRLAGPDHAELAFVDLRDGERWLLRPNEGPLAWWIFDAKRRVPGTRAGDYVGLAAMMVPQPGRRVDQVLKAGGVLWDRLLDPFLLAALNTDAATGSADLAGAIVRETLARGGKAYRPRIAEPTLAAAFIEPALRLLEGAGAAVRLNHRLRGLAFEGTRVTGLNIGGETVALAPGDRVILAVPPWIAPTLVPGVKAPDEFRAIVNGHFRIAPPPGAAPIVGVIGGTAQWVFAFNDRLSTTISGADHFMDMDREALIGQLWRDVCAVHGLSGPVPPWQIVKERRATFAATPQQAAKRAKAATAWSNLFLAGDWTDTGLPATIEGALRSGETAAALALRAV
jgi:squalene-associated FAD-dependent desaturase